MEYYPEQMRWLANLCDALDRFDAENPEKNTHMMIAQQIPIVDVSDASVLFGHVVDEIGGIWGFRPLDSQSE